MEKKAITCKIVNKLGLHARASATFVKLANKFDSEILVSKGTTSVNGKSIMGLLMLAAAQGTKIKVTAEGSDASEAIDKLQLLISEGFNEN